MEATLALSPALAASTSFSLDLKSEFSEDSLEVVSKFSEVNLRSPGPWREEDKRSASSLETFLTDSGSGSIVSSKASLVAKLLFIEWPCVLLMESLVPEVEC